MKKISTLLCAAALLLGCVSDASAIDFKAKGQWVMSFDYGENLGFSDGPYGAGNDEDNFNAQQRIRLQLDAVASESLSGTVYFEIGTQTWGKAAEGGSLGADGREVKVSRPTSTGCCPIPM